MTDQDVAFLLHSDLALATIEAPAGCGKTFQGANYALDVASSLAAGRVLILTHTHAARSVFANRTRKLLDRVEIRTLDSFLTEIAAMYHRSLNLPLDVGSWALENSAYDVVAARCRELLECSGNVARAAALGYPIIICDEHQDASADQHAAIMAIHRAGSRVRFLGDPMQIIYGGAGTKTSAAIKRWAALKNEGGCGHLANPHRWRSGSIELGEWVLAAREVLASGKAIDLAGKLPAGLTVLHAANSARVAHKAITMTADDRRQVSEIARKSSQLFVLTVGNERVNHLNAFFNRSVRIWEGHGREALSSLVKSIDDNPRSASEIVEALLTFVEETCTGFSASLHGRRLEANPYPAPVFRNEDHAIRFESDLDRMRRFRVVGAITALEICDCLFSDARTFGQFDTLCAEALDRISRDQEDMAHIYKALRFRGIALHTVAEGLADEMHIGLKGTMNALFLKDLAEKTRRGQRGRIEKGRSGGGLAYGYDLSNDGEGSASLCRRGDAQCHCGGAEPEGCTWARWTGLGRYHYSWASCARYRYPQQCTLSRRAYLEPAAFHRGSSHRKASGAP